MILQLDPAIPLITPRGRAIAHLVIDYGIEADLMWVCFGDDGQIWTWPNPKVRADSNITLGRDKEDG